MHDYWFFLSYARIDKIGPYLRRFHKDLSEEIRRRAALPASTSIQQIGFFDETIKVGEKWPDSIAAALQSTRTLVCLYSHGYFGSSQCGKEFEVFRQRTDPDALPLIMPVLWDAPQDLPPFPSAVAQIQYSHSAFGDIYAEQGLYSIISLNKYQDDYKQFIRAFARQLKTHVQEFTARPFDKPLSLSQVRNPFEIPETEVDGSMRSAKSDGPSTVQFYFFAGKKADLASIKTETEAYGEKRERDWRPFFPEVKDSAGLISQRAATQARLIAEMYPIEKDFTDQLSKAEEENTIVCLLIDPWTVQLEFYRNCLTDYDAKRLVNCGALVIWNEHDRELPARSHVLKQHVKEVFWRLSMSKDPSFRDSIRSVGSLRKEIRVTILEIQQRLIRRGKVLRPVSGTGKPPSISGSWRHFDG